MSLEDQVRTHEEWLRSIDSNLDRLAAGLVAIDQKLEVTNDALAVVAQNQASFSAALASLTRQQQENAAVSKENAALSKKHEAQILELREQHKEMAAQHQRLEQAFEQYLRSRTNGRQN